LIIDMGSLLPVGPGLATYTVWLASSAKIPNGPGPTRTWAGGWAQPEVSRALQVAPLNTATVLVPSTVTYTVSVAWSTVMVDGRLPTVTVGHGPAHRDAFRAWQRRPSITETVSPPAFAGPLALLPLAT
jgi:hypothetical protein